MMVQRSVVVLLVLVSLTECKDGASKISSRDEVEMVRIPMISGYTKVGDPIYRDFYPRYRVSGAMNSKTLNHCSASDRFNFLVRARRIS